MQSWLQIGALVLLPFPVPLEKVRHQVMILVDLKRLLSSCLRPGLFRRSCFQYAVVESDVKTSRETFSMDTIVYLVEFCRLFAAFRTFSGTRVFPKIQLRRVQRGTGV